MSPEVFLNKFPEIEIDEKIVIREIDVEKDAGEYYIYMNNPGVAKYLAEEDIPSCIEHAKHELKYWNNLFHNKYSVYWTIALKEDGRSVGTCGFNNWNYKHDRAEISIDINPEFWGKGIATKVIKHLCNYAFNEMKVKRIQATIEKSNFASMRVFTKNKFQREGLLVKYAKLAGINCDFYMYSLTKKTD